MPVPGKHATPDAKQWLVGIAVVIVLCIPALFITRYYDNKKQQEFEGRQDWIEQEDRKYEESVYRNSVEGIAERTKIDHDPYKKYITFKGPSGAYSWQYAYHSGYDYSLGAVSDDASKDIDYALYIDINKGSDLLAYFIELNGDRYDLTAVSNEGGLPEHYGYTIVTRAYLEDRVESGIKLRAYTISNDHWDIEIAPEYIQGFLKAVDEHVEASASDSSE